MDTAILVACLALLGTLFGSIATWTTARRSNFISNVTSERMKWIDFVRSLVTDLQAKTLNFVLSLTYIESSRETSTIIDRAEAMRRLEVQLTVFLSKRGKIEDNVVELMRSMMHAAMKSVNPKSDKRKEWLSKVSTYSELLTAHCGYLFKQEWEQIKSKQVAFFTVYI